MNRKITEVVEQLAQPILHNEQMELVDIEYKKEGNHRFLRLFFLKKLDDHKLHLASTNNITLF